MTQPARKPRKHLLSRDDYHRMAEAEILAPDLRVELIEGEIIDMTPIGSRHAGCVARIHSEFVIALNEQAMVFSQSPVILGDLSEPEPDILLLKPRHDWYTESHPVPADVLLLIEVSDSSRDYDRHKKIPLYARYNISEVWQVELEDERLTQFRDAGDGHYQVVNTAAELGSLSVLALPGFTINMGFLFQGTS